MTLGKALEQAKRRLEGKALYKLHFIGGFKPEIHPPFNSLSKEEQEKWTAAAEGKGRR